MERRAVTRPSIVLRPWVRPVAGIACAAAAWSMPGRVAGGVAWIAALVIGCSGFGIAIERAVRQRASEAQTIVIGLSVLLLCSLAAAYAGLLARDVQFGAVLIGIIASGLPRVGPAPRQVHHGAVACAVVAGVTLSAVALIRRDPVIGDGANHVFAIRQLWDTGRLTLTHHQLGVELIGESYAALVAGGDAIGVFEPGLCCALVLLLLAVDVAGTDRRALMLFGIAALPIAMRPEFTAWSAVALQLTAFWSLAAAVRSRRRGWSTLIAALALICLRHEYILLALPYAVAAVIAPCGAEISSRVATTAVAAWWAVMVALQAALGVPIAQAAPGALVLLLMIPATAAALHLAGPLDRRGAFAPALLGAFTTTAAIALEAIRSVQHSPVAMRAIWVAVALALLGALGGSATREQRGPGQVGLFAGTLVLGSLFVFMLLVPAYEGDEHGRQYHWFSQAVIELRDRMALHEMSPSDDVRVGQQLVPRRARIGFWGRSAGRLDFRRNSIRDLSWPVESSHRRDVYFLSSLQPAALSGIDYLLVEGVKLGQPLTLWDVPGPPAIVYTANRLELLAQAGAVRVYRVRR